MLFVIILFYVTLYYSLLIIILYVHILICDEIRENSELVDGSVEQDSRILFNG